MEELQKRAFQYKLYQKNFKVITLIMPTECSIKTGERLVVINLFLHQLKFGLFSSLKRRRPSRPGKSNRTAEEVSYVK